MELRHVAMRAGVLVTLAVAWIVPLQAADPIASDGPRYDSQGRLVFSQDYREWVFLSAGLDMSYVDPLPPANMHMFSNVFVNPSAYHSYLQTGTWPDGTMFVLEVRPAESKGSINKSGSFQSGPLVGIETHVRDSKRFDKNWAFFVFNGARAPAMEVPHNAECYSCHEAHAAVDTTFVQFYPTLLGTARSRKTFSSNYLKDESSNGAR